MLKSFAKEKVLPRLNRLLRPASLKVVPASSPTRDFADFLGHVRRLGIEFETIIDVGVAFGSPGLYRACPAAKFYLVEPVPSAKAHLDKLAQELGAEVFNVAAGATDGEMTFFVHPDTSGSSAFRQWEGADLDGEEVVVPVRRLDAIIPRPVARPALLKIDTQGAELDVLAGAAELLNDIDMLIIEVSFHEFRKGAPEFHHIVQRMTELGYVCYEVLEGHYRAIDGALAQEDLVFIRPDSPLRAHKTYFSPEQAARYRATSGGAAGA